MGWHARERKVLNEGEIFYCCRRRWNEQKRIEKIFHYFKEMGKIFYKNLIYFNGFPKNRNLNKKLSARFAFGFTDIKINFNVDVV